METNMMWVSSHDHVEEEQQRNIEGMHVDTGDSLSYICLSNLMCEGAFCLLFGLIR